MKLIKLFLLWFVIGVLVTVTIYGLYWIAKTGSYVFFYEDMVIGTIKQTVINECFK